MSQLFNRYRLKIRARTIGAQLPAIDRNIAAPCSLRRISDHHPEYIGLANHNLRRISLDPYHCSGRLRWCMAIVSSTTGLRVTADSPWITIGFMDGVRSKNCKRKQEEYPPAKS